MRGVTGVFFALGAVGCGTSGAQPGPSDAAPDATLDAGADAPAPADAGADVTPRGARTLALDINPAEDGNYLTALAIALDAGVQATNVSVNWNAIETIADAGADGGDGGDASVTYFNPNFHIANLVFPQSHTKVALAIRPVDTGGPMLPDDLKGRPLDDPGVIARFNAAQDYIFGEIPDLSLSGYLLGNEIDDAFGTDAAKWGAYKTFFDAAAAYAKTLRPGVRIGTVVTWKGATTHPELVKPLLASADFVGITYYPLNGDYSVRPVAGVRADFDALVALYGDKPIFVREAGCPSGAPLGSSPEQQAEFVRQIYLAWDAYADKIPVLTFFTMNEYSAQSVSALVQYYGVSDPNFATFLGTVGLRTYSPGSGTNKPGWDAVVAGARARGW